MPDYITWHTHLQRIKGRFWNSTNTVAKQLATWKPESTLGHKQTLFLLHFGGGKNQTHARRCSPKKLSCILIVHFPSKVESGHICTATVCAPRWTLWCIKRRKNLPGKDVILHMKKGATESENLVTPTKGFTRHADSLWLQVALLESMQLSKHEKFSLALNSAILFLSTLICYSGCTFTIKIYESNTDNYTKTQPTDPFFFQYTHFYNQLSRVPFFLKHKSNWIVKV